MGYSNGKITAPVSVSDVKAVLGSSSNNVGTLCTASNIKLWSKHKPVKYPQDSKMTETDFKNANYGIHTVKTAGSIVAADLAGILNNARTNNGQWPDSMWNKPTGYFRLADFEGYNHYATSPYKLYIPNNVEGANDSIEIDINLENKGDSSILSISEMNIDGVDIASYKIGAVYKEYGTEVVKYTNTTIQQLDSKSIGHSIQIPVTLHPGNTEGTVIAGVSDGADTGDFIYIPGGYFNISYTKVPVILSVYMRAHDLEPTIEYNDYGEKYVSGIVDPGFFYIDSIKPPDKFPNTNASSAGYIYLSCELYDDTNNLLTYINIPNSPSSNNSGSISCTMTNGVASFNSPVEILSTFNFMDLGVSYETCQMVKKVLVTLDIEKYTGTASMNTMSNRSWTLTTEGGVAPPPPPAKNYDIKFVNMTSMDLGINISEDGNAISTFDTQIDSGWNLDANGSLSWTRTSGHVFTLSQDAAYWWDTNSYIHNDPETDGLIVEVRLQGSYYVNLYNNVGFEVNTNQGNGPYIVEINAWDY